MEVNGQLHSQEKSCGTHWLRGWVTQEFGLDLMTNINIPTPIGIQTLII
jgi:hypothetical protein